MELSKEVTQDSKNIALLIIDRDCISGPVNFFCDRNHGVGR